MIVPFIKATSRSFSENPQLRQEILQHFPNTVFNETGDSFPPEKLIAYLKDADGVVLGTEKMDANVLRQLPNLKIITKYGVGLDNLDVDAAKLLGKVVGWTPGTNKRSVAEESLGFMLGLCRNLFFSGFQLKQGVWNKHGGMQLTGKCVGIVGCGNTGSEVLKLLQPFACDVLICDILDKSELAREYGARQVSFEELLPQVDVLTLHVPLTEQTHYMMNDTTLKTMKSSAFLINLSRGPVVSQESLKHALTEKVIAGAALDVFEQEPPTDLKFLALPNLMVAPHIGGNAHEAVLAMGRAAIEHLVNHFVKS
ncbi:MAG: phosphoglycerate dehydrogenase [SAR324 cluster bacterium]|nr:phosphoglycerate dehydrogenase [SAR324 cluster bacterium]